MKQKYFNYKKIVFQSKRSLKWLKTKYDKSVMISSETVHQFKIKEKHDRAIRLEQEYDLKTQPLGHTDLRLIHMQRSTDMNMTSAQWCYLHNNIIFLVIILI